MFLFLHTWQAQGVSIMRYPVHIPQDVYSICVITDVFRPLPTKIVLFISHIIVGAQLMLLQNKVVP